MKPIIKKLMEASESLADKPILEQEKTGWLRSTPKPTQHTPGPWKQFGNRIIKIGDYANKSVAEAFGTSEDEEQANARLIAAAPDLLAALYIARTYVAHYGKGPDAQQDRDTIDAAIAAAEGRDK